MVTPRAYSLLIRVSALFLALFGLIGRDSSAKAPMVMQTAPAIPVPNLMGYWALDGATGTLTPDSSGAASPNDGTLVGGAVIDTANKPSIPSGNVASLALTGTSNQLVSVPDSTSLSITGSLTLSAWVRPTIAPDSVNGWQHGIIEKWDWTGSTAIAGYMLRLDRVNNLSFAICGASANTGISTAPRAVPSAGGWTHVAATYNSTNGSMIMYVGGNPDPTTGNASTGAPTNGAAELHIGVDYGANRFGGNIDDARVYNRALSAAEILILRDGQPAPTMLAPVALSGMNQLSWTPPAGAPAGITYSLLWGPSSNNYTNVINGITGTSYDHTAAPAGVPTFYRVVAVTVMTSPQSNEVSSTPGPTGPPPPPPPPRTTASDHEACGCGTASPMPGEIAALALAVALIALVPGLFRRG